MLKTAIEVSPTSCMNLCDWVFPDSLAAATRRQPGRGGRRWNQGLHIQVVWPGSAAHPAAGPATRPGVHQRQRLQLMSCCWGQFLMLVGIIGEVKGLCVGVWNSASSTILAETVLLCGVVGPVLLIRLLIIITAWASSSLPCGQLIAWGGHGRKWGSWGRTAIIIGILGGGQFFRGVAQSASTGVERGLLFALHTIFDPLKKHIEKLNDVEQQGH